MRMASVKRDGGTLVGAVRVGAGGVAQRRIGVSPTRAVPATGQSGPMDTTTLHEHASPTRHVAVNALAPVALTLIALILIWRASVGPALGELGWIVAGGTVAAVAMGWSAVAMIGALFGIERRPGDTAIAFINASNLLAWLTLFDGAF
jgi:hypothetical protein